MRVREVRVRDVEDTVHIEYSAQGGEEVLLPTSSWPVRILVDEDTEPTTVIRYLRTALDWYDREQTTA